MRKWYLIMALIVLASSWKHEEVEGGSSEKEQFIGLRDDGLCEGNHFLFLSTYMLGRQQDLTLTIAEINRTAAIDEVTFSDQPYRTYRIFNVRPSLIYLESRQTAELQGQNVLRIMNGPVKINFAFEWEKTQLGSSLHGTGTGNVSTDGILFQKTLTTNTTHELQWHLTRVDNITISKGISLSKMEPYSKPDYQILSNMFNKLPSDKTLRDLYVELLNKNFKSILNQTVLNDTTLKFDHTITYPYSDYRGRIELLYNQTLMNSTLAQDGLYLLFSQVLIGDSEFQCGPAVPQVPDDPLFGGLQEFYSNSLIKSTLKHVIKNGSLDVILSQQFWQSRAFQFFMGDVHEVMPSSTKNMSTMIELVGRCDGLVDPAFSFSAKSSSAYDVKVNFQCRINYDNNKTRLTSLDMVVSYEVAPKLGTKYLDFVLNNIAGSPVFRETGNFKVQYHELAEFMVAETLALAKDSPIFGSGYRTVNRKYPGVWVKNNYLFLYDSSAKPKGVYKE